jgi:hypothetical protein
VSDVEIGVGVGGRHLECQESWCGSDGRQISGFCLLELEGPYVVADEGFETSAWNED